MPICPLAAEETAKMDRLRACREVQRQSSKERYPFCLQQLSQGRDRIWDVRRKPASGIDSRRRDTLVAATVQYLKILAYPCFSGRGRLSILLSKFLCYSASVGA